MTAHVYRIYDADDVLLYVGCSSNPEGRLSTHRLPVYLSHSNLAYASDLSARYHRAEVSPPYEHRLDAEDAEMRAIRAERPVFNRQWSLPTERDTG